MQRIRFIALAIGAALTLGAAVSATASAALPEWFKGGAVITANVKFKGKSGAGLLQTKGGTQVKCTGGSAEGEIVPAKAISKTEVAFTGCELVGGGECKTVGDAAEEVKTKALKGELGYIEKPTKKVGLKLEPEEAGGLFANFICVLFIGMPEEMRGGMIAKTEPLNVEQTTGKLVLQQTPKGVQDFKKFEGGPETSLECKWLLQLSFEGCAWEETWEMEWQPAGTKVEVKA